MGFGGLEPFQQLIVIGIIVMFIYGISQSKGGNGGKKSGGGGA